MYIRAQRVVIGGEFLSLQVFGVMKNEMYTVEGIKNVSTGSVPCEGFHSFDGTVSGLLVHRLPKSRDERRTGPSSPFVTLSCVLPIGHGKPKIK